MDRPGKTNAQGDRMYLMKQITKHLFHKVIDLFLSRRQQIHLGSNILYRAFGQGNDDSAANGEYRVLSIIKSRVKDRDAVFFDVGAHIGEWVKESVARMGNKLRVYAFEPSKQAFLSLQDHFSLWNIAARVQLVNAALSESNGSAELFLMGELAGTHSLHQCNIQALHLQQSGAEKIRTYRGDTFCEEANINHIDFLKIDTEGHEMSVLLGFDGMLSKGAIDFIQFEYGGTWIGAHRFFLDAFEYLHSRGYMIGRIHPEGLEFLKCYDHKLENFVYCNYLAVRPEHADKFPVIV